ncbi:MAG TPA: hypothetical protein VGK73_24110 [Polyangiaceae bacterium]
MPTLLALRALGLPRWQSSSPEPKRSIRVVHFFDIDPEDWNDQEALAFERFIQRPTCTAEEVERLRAWFDEVGRRPRSCWRPRRGTGPLPAPAQPISTERVDRVRCPRHWAIALAFSCAPIAADMRRGCARFVDGVSARAVTWASELLAELEPPPGQNLAAFVEQALAAVRAQLAAARAQLIEESLQSVATELQQARFFDAYEPSLGFGRVLPLLEAFVATAARERALKEFKQLVLKRVGGLGGQARVAAPGARAKARDAWKELFERKPELLSRLPPKQRRAVELCDLGGLAPSVAEDREGAARGGIRKALADAHRRVRAILDGKEP